MSARSTPIASLSPTHRSVHALLLGTFEGLGIPAKQHKEGICAGMVCLHLQQAAYAPHPSPEAILYADACHGLHIVAPHMDPEARKLITASINTSYVLQDAEVSGLVESQTSPPETPLQIEVRSHVLSCGDRHHCPACKPLLQLAQRMHFLQSVTEHGQSIGSAIDLGGALQWWPLYAPTRPQAWRDASTVLQNAPEGVRLHMRTEHHTWLLTTQEQPGISRPIAHSDLTDVSTTEAGTYELSQGHIAANTFDALHAAMGFHAARPHGFWTNQTQKDIPKEALHASSMAHHLETHPSGTDHDDLYAALTCDDDRAVALILQRPSIPHLVADEHDILKHAVLHASPVSVERIADLLVRHNPNIVEILALGIACVGHHGSARTVDTLLKTQQRLSSKKPWKDAEKRRFSDAWDEGLLDATKHGSNEVVHAIVQHARPPCSTTPGDMLINALSFCDPTSCGALVAHMRDHARVALPFHMRSRAQKLAIRWGDHELAGSIGQLQVLKQSKIRATLA